MMSLTGLMNKFLKTILSISLLLLVMQSQAQEVNKDSIRSMRMTKAAGKWFSGGINLGFVSVGQSSSSTLLTVTDGQIKYTGSFGFLPPLIKPEEPNNPPVATVPAVAVFYEEGDIIQLDGSDPDGDEIGFEVTEQPLLGELTASGTDGNAFTFKPSASLTPGNGYRDTVRFKVYETLKDLESEVAAYAFTFNVEDKGHTIVSFEQVTATTEQKTFALSFEDDQFNTDYKVILQYIDLSDPINPELLIISNSNIPLSNLTADGNKLTATIVANSVNFPYLFNADKVFITAEVSTSTGFSDDDAFILDNAASGTVVNVGDGPIADIRLDAVSSDDGQFFTFSTQRSTPENTDVELKLFAIELGGFDLTDADIEITTDPKTGSFSDPVIEKQTSGLAQWSVTYSPVGEVGYLDSLEFTVDNKARDFKASSFAKVEVVDVNDPPQLGNVANQVFDEEGTLTVELEFDDPDGELSLTVTSADPDNLPVTVNGNQFSVTGAVDFNGAVNVNVLVQEIDTDETYSRSQTITFEVQAVNDQPVLEAIADQVVDEDNPFTYTLSTSDVDAALPIFAYSILPDVPGVVDIAVDGNQLTITPETDYNGTINFTVTADDQTGQSNSISEAQTFQLVINPVNDLPEITNQIPDQNLIEGFPTYTIDLGLYFEDVETADADLIYSVVETSALFDLSITNDQLSVAPVAGQSGMESLTIMASDGEANVSQVVNFDLEPISADIQVSNSIDDIQLMEDFTSYTIDLSNVFIDANDDQAVFTFNTSGLDNLIATVNGTDLIITTPANYNGSEELILLGSANDKSSFLSFNITVSPVNDEPTIDAVDDQTIQEDFDLTNVFAAFNDIDNSVDDLTVTVTSSNQDLIKDESISLSKGESGVSLEASPEENQFGKTTITLTLSDGDLTTSTDFEVTVNSVNDQPEVIGTSLTGAIEDEPYAVDMSTLFTDIDEDELQYTFEDKPDWLVLANGQLGGSPENDDVGSVSFTIIADDGSGGTVRQEYDLTVTNTNDAPEVLDGTADAEATEDAFLSLEIPDDAFVDVDGDGLVFTAAFTGADWLSFDDQINRFVGTPANDDVGTVDITITATDPDGAFVTDQFTLTVENTNDSPTGISSDGQSVDENSVDGSEVGTLSTEDVDVGDTHTYSLVAGDGAADNDSFTIVGDVIQTAAVLDFEAQSSYSIRVRSTDSGGATVDEVIAIMLGDVNEAPTDLSVDNTSIDENAAAGTELGSLASVDEDTGDSFSYSLVSGTGDDDNASFEISGGKLLSKASFDFEIKSAYSIRLKTTDADGLSFEKAISISVSDVNEVPTVLGISATSIVENADSGTEVGDLTTEDPDANDTHSYALVSGEGDGDNELFAISNGALVSAASLNFEERSTYQVRVATEDAGGLSLEQSITVTVTDANDAPADITVDNLTVTENGASGDLIGVLLTVDEDAGDSHTYALVAGEGSDDNASFELDGVQLKATAAFDFELKSSYAVRVRTTDAGGLTSEKSITVMVTDANDAPTDIMADDLSIAENGAAGDLVGTLTTADQDATDTHTYALVAGEGSDDNASFELDGDQLKALDAFDFETKSTYSIRVSTTDEAGASHEKSLTVMVDNQPEPAIEDISGITFDDTPSGESSTASFTIVNTGDTDIDVTNITAPDGFSVSTTTLTVAVGSSANVEVTFSPTEVKTYTGQLVMTSNVGQTNIDVTGIGTIVTSIDDDVIAESDISVYPNPASTTVVIDLTDIVYLRPDVAIFTTSGINKFQREAVTDEKISLDVAQYNAGTYLVRIATSKGIVVKKLMIVK